MMSNPLATHSPDIQLAHKRRQMIAAGYVVMASFFAGMIAAGVMHAYAHKADADQHCAQHSSVSFAMPVTIHRAGGSHALGSSNLNCAATNFPPDAQHLDRLDDQRIVAGQFSFEVRS